MSLRWHFRPIQGRPSADAQHAAEEARRGLKDAENLACRLEDVADRLSKTRERNHFAAAVARALRGA
jgi:hypothetical protein